MRLVENMQNNKGRSVPNQFLVVGTYNGHEGLYFQSYKSLIAFKPSNGANITLDRGTWDHSTTTGKYRNRCLVADKKATQKNIDAGEYILADLNSFRHSSRFTSAKVNVWIYV